MKLPKWIVLALVLGAIASTSVAAYALTKKDRVVVVREVVRRQTPPRVVFPSPSISIPTWRSRPIPKPRNTFLDDAIRDALGGSSSAPPTWTDSELDDLAEELESRLDSDGDGWTDDMDTYGGGPDFGDDDGDGLINGLDPYPHDP